MEFNANNPVIKRCLQAMAASDNHQPEEARKLFLQAWNDAANGLEKCITAQLLGRHEQDPNEQLKWLEKSLEAARTTDSISVQTALPSLYKDIARCYTNLGDISNALANSQLAVSAKSGLKDPGPFYHGTKADLKTGDLLIAGGRSNYQAGVTMNHIYFTALPDGAGLAAALAKGRGNERIYQVEPTGIFEDDPNVTDKKFPGNPTRSYRSEAPLKITGELSNWQKLTFEEKQEWHAKLAENNGKIIN